VTTSKTPARAGIARGFTTDSYGVSMTGPNVSASRKTAELATAALAHQRQWSDGSDPLNPVLNLPWLAECLPCLIIRLII